MPLRLIPWPDLEAPPLGPASARREDRPPKCNSRPQTRPPVHSSRSTGQRGNIVPKPSPDPFHPFLSLLINPRSRRYCIFNTNPVALRNRIHLQQVIMISTNIRIRIKSPYLIRKIRSGDNAAEEEL